jgi:hypothetical protein
MRNAECGILIPDLLPGTADCETAIEIFFNPHSPFPTPCDNVNGNSGLYLLGGTIKYVFSIS